MRALALRDASTLGIQALTSGILTTFPELDPPRAVDYFIRSNWVTVPDPETAEYVRSPAAQLRALESGQPFMGDCDDAATLICSLLAAADYPCWFSAIRLPGAEDFSHVYAQASSPGRFVIDLDPTVNPDQLPITGYEERLFVSVYE